MLKVLVSACLMGCEVRYDGAACRLAHPVLEEWRDTGRLVWFCPEATGAGMAVPRAPAEIQGGDGEAILDGRARVVTIAGADVTEAFVVGARAALAAAREAGVALAVLKEKSPSCGSGWIHSGGFDGKMQPGRGVTAALLVRHGIAVFNECQLVEAQAWLKAREAFSREPGPTERSTKPSPE